MNILSIWVNPPPLGVQIVIKKSKFKIHNDAQLVVLTDKDGTIEWQCENFLADGFDVWQFINKEDEDNYNKDAA